MKKKLSESELKALRDAVEKTNSLQLKIGNIEVQKHELLHEIESAKKEFNSVQTMLQNAYGMVTIDISTGEIQDDGIDTQD